MKDKLEGKTVVRNKDELDKCAKCGSKEHKTHAHSGAKGKALKHMKEGGQWKGNLDKAEKDK